jgi:trehalose 6-phosphate phosphatase
VPPLTASAVPGFLGDPSETAIVLDFDGTLAPIVRRPELAAPAAGIAAELDRLVGTYALVAIVTGRPEAQIRERLPAPGVRVEGLYGLRDPDLARSIVEAVEAAAAEVPGAWVERKGASAAVHLRETADPEAAEVSLRPPLEAIAAAHDLEIAPGKRVLELVPAGRPRKGESVERLVSDAGVRAVLFAGDDLADLEAFAALDRLAAAGLRTVKVAVRGSETPASLAAVADLVVEGVEGTLALLRAF